MENSALLPIDVIRYYTDIYTFDWLHNVFLGTSPLLKKNLIFYLDSDRPISVNNRVRKLASIRTAVLRGCNSVLRYFQTHSVMPGTRIDFSKSYCSSSLNGLYPSTGLRGMLEGKDFKALDTVFPFIFAYVDTWLGQHSEAPLTSIHSRYTSLVQQVISDNDGLGWSPDCLTSLEESISSFKEDMTTLFHETSPTGIGTLKFHLIDHIRQDLQSFGSMRMLTTSPFEHFNTHIKSAHSSTSGRLLSRDAETAATLIFNLSRRVLADTPSTLRAQQSSSVSSATHFGLVQSGTCLPISYFSSCTTCSTPESNELVRSIQNNLPRDAFNQLCVLLKGELQQNRIPSIASRTKLNIVQSGYIDGGFDPTLSDCKEIDGIPVLKTTRSFTKRRQRVFGITWDRSHQARKQSYVAIKGLEDGDLDVYWVGQVLLLFHLNEYGEKVSKEYAFVQFMEVTSCLSKVDEELGCVCLRWATADNVDYTTSASTHITAGQIEAAEWYDLVPFDSIVGTVQALRSNIPIPPFTKPIPWPLHRFHINRFFLNKDPVID